MPGYTRQFLAPFIGGLNTELPQTQDALQYTSDELNCTILREGMRGRRYGFNIERDGDWLDNNASMIRTSEIFSWANANADKNFIVIQLDTTLYIFEDIKPITKREPKAVIDLTPFISYSNVDLEPISFTSVADTLFVAARWLYPLVIKYNIFSDTFEKPVINNLLFRDFNGVEDMMEIDETTQLYNTRHIYNLFNQGWHSQVYDEYGKNGKYLVTAENEDGKRGRFYDDLGYYPANNMQWFLGKNSTGKYNTGDLMREYFGNTPAPKGHFILDYLHRSRSYTSGITVDNTTGGDITEQDPFIHTANIKEPLNVINDDGSQLTGGNRHYWVTATFYENYLYRNRSLKEWEESAFYKQLSTYEKPRWVVNLPYNISGKLTKFSLQLEDWFTTGVPQFGEDPSLATYWYNNVRNSNRSEIRQRYIWAMDLNIKVWGYNEDGTGEAIYEMNYTPTGKVGSVMNIGDIVLNPTKPYVSYGISVRAPYVETKQGRYMDCDEIRFKIAVKELNYSQSEGTSYEGLPVSDLLKGAVTDVEAFGGRIFYLCGNTVLFSQTLGQDNKNYEKCYQDADPTSEEISDVIATDGGMVQLLTIGEGKKLKAFYRGIIVFGEREVDGILSSTEKLFSAVEYDMVKITNAGLIGKNTVVENDNNMFYWSSHGIYMISIDENNNISSKCISLASIQNWYNELSTSSKENCRGYFDYANNRIYWFYPTQNINNLDGCLVYDLTYNCFMPQQISSTNDTPTIIACAPSTSIYDVAPTLYLRAGGHRVVAGDYNIVIKSTEDPKFVRKTAGNVLIKDEEGYRFSLGDFNSREYYDWDNKNFDSYLVSRPIVEGDTYYNKQTPILQTLFKRTEGYKMLDKEDKPSNKYRIKNMLTYSNTQISERTEHLISLTRVLNTGIAKELLLNVDYSNTDIQRIEVVIRDDKDWNNIIGSKTITDVQEHNTISITNLDQSECNGFTIVCTGVTNSMGSTTQQSCNGTFYLQRTNLEEPQFLEYIPRTVSKTIEVTKEFDQVLWNDDKGYDFTREVDIEYRPIASLTEYPYNYFQYSINVTGPVGRETEHLGQSDRPLIIRNTANFITGNITTSFKDLKYRDRGVEEEKTAFESVYKAQLTYTFTIYQAVFKDENAISTEYTTPSGAYLRMRWGWSLDKDSNRWDMVQNAYRPQKDFLHDEFVESRVHIRGRGKAYQVEVRNDDNKDFRLSGMNIIIRSPN